MSQGSLGDRDRLTLALRGGFGGDLRARGEFAQALEFDQETRRLDEEVFGPTDPQTLRMANNVAIDFGLNSRYREARDLCRRAYLLMRESTSGVSSQQILVAWYNLAWSLRLEGLYDEARDVGEAALAFGRVRLGPDHYATLRTSIGLSIALRRIPPERGRAMQIAEEVYATCEPRFGLTNPDTMAAAINLVNAQRVNGLLAEAMALAQRTVAAYPRVYGPEHPYNFGCSGNLALLRRVTGDLAGARDMNETALEGLDSRVGRDHTFSLVIAVNLASDLAELGSTHQARTLGEDTLARLGRILGEQHPFTLGCAANLSFDLRADGAEAEAELLRDQTMQGYASTLGLAHPDAVVYAAGGRLDFDFDPPPI
jgi:hypothetical protein